MPQLMDAGEQLVAAHLTSLYPSSQISAIPIHTSRHNTPLPPAPKQNGPPVEHAIFSTTVHAPILGTVVLRVLHQGLILELLSLSVDVQPLRLVLPSPVVPSPAIFLWEGTEIHVLAVTEFGSIFRLVLPIVEGNLWQEPVRTNWCREYLIKSATIPIDGLVHIQGTHCVIIGQRNGSLLRIETEYLGDDRRSDIWTETLLQHSNLLYTITSFLPGLHTGPSSTPEIVSIATHPQPTDIGYIWTLSRDRTVRLWSPKIGCVYSKVLASSFGRDAEHVRSSPSGSKPQTLIEGERQVLLRAFSTNLVGEQLYLLAFIPTPSSTTAGGFFQLLKTESDELYEQGRMECSSISAHCHLQDFIVVADNLYVLWDRQGRSVVEKTLLNPDEFNMSEIGNAWKLASYPEEPELTPAYLDELLLWPGSLTNKFFEAVMRPGMFSTFTLRTALDQYIEACLTLPSVPSQQLRMVLSSLGENVIAVVGFTVNFLRDPTTGALQYDKYWNALKRDWEGFIARCREIERSARWPLALSVSESKGLLVIERERIGCLVAEDEPSRLRRRLIAGIELTSNAYALMEILWALRVRLGTQAMWLLEGQMIDICHQEIVFTLADIVKDAAVRVDLKEYLEDGLDAWIGGRLQSIENMAEAARFILDVLGSFDTVKEEVTEEIEVDLSEPPPPPPHSVWSKALISSFIASTAHARYELSLTLALLFFFLPEYDWPPSLLDEMLAVFRGTAMARFVVRQPANPIVRSPNADATADDVATRLENMHVNSHGRSHFAPAHSVVQHMLSQCLHIPSIARAAHLFLDQSGLLQSVSLSRATRFEVEFCHGVAKLGFTEISRQLLDWLPRTIGVSFLYADLLIRAGQADDAAYLLEKLAPRFGRSHALCPEDQLALRSVLSLDSEFAFYKHAAFVLFKDSWIHYQVTFSQLALSVAPPDQDTTDLWNAIIDGHTALAQFDEAYCALVSAPPNPSKGDRVVNLVYRMCEEDVVEKLMSYNFAGFADEVQEALAFKARNVDPRGRPIYARILYSWFVSRGDYRNAALTMYQRARKLHNLISDPATLFVLAEQQLEAYLIAINSLSLVDPKSAWVALPVQQDHGHEPRKRRKLSKYIPETSYSSSKDDAEIIGLADMQYEHTLLSARLDLARKDNTLIYTGEFLLTPPAIILRLIQANRFDYAMATARSLNEDMSELFAHLTGQCLRLSKAPELVLAEDTSDWLLTDKVSSWPGTPADKGWRYLRQSLARHDNAETDYKYSKVTLETILGFDRSWQSPPWLIQTLEEHHHEYLIRINLRFENVEAALLHTASLVRKADAQLAPELSKFTASTWLPYSLIDQVLAVSDGDDFPARIKTLRSKLQSDLSYRVKRMEKLSEFPR